MQKETMVNSISSRGRHCYVDSSVLTILQTSVRIPSTPATLFQCCLFCLDSAALLMLNEEPLYLFGQIQTSQTGGQLYSDTFPPMVSVIWFKLSYTSIMASQACWILRNSSWVFGVRFRSSRSRRWYLRTRCIGTVNRSRSRNRPFSASGNVVKMEALCH